MVQTPGRRPLRLTMYFFFFFFFFFHLSQRVHNPNAELFMLESITLWVKGNFNLLLYAFTLMLPSLPTSNHIKTKWQPFEVTEYTSSFISVWTHQKGPLYRDLNLGDSKMTDWFTNTVWQRGLATLSCVPWEPPVSSSTPGQCFTPFYHSSDYQLRQL